MLAKGVNSKSTWKQCMRLIKHDPRWGALKTNGQKKQVRDPRCLFGLFGPVKVSQARIDT